MLPPPDEKDPFPNGMEDMEKFLKRYEIKRIHKDFFQKIALLIIASFGFIAAIAWDQALKLIFTEFFGSIDSVGDKLLYASLITIMAVLMSIILTKLFFKEEKGK